MKLGTELRILVDYPYSSRFIKNDIVVVIEIESRVRTGAQIKGGEEWWYINKNMEGKHWEVVDKEQK